MAAKPKIVEEVFRVPSLEEVDAEYAAIIERHKKVSIELAANTREQHELEADMKKNPPVRAVRAGLADILGDVVEVDGRPARLAELRKRAHDLEDAAKILFKRQQERKGIASKAAREVCKREYARRVNAFIATLKAAQEAYRAVDDMIEDFVANDIDWMPLGVARPGFLGPVRDGRIDHFVKEMKGYGFEG